MADSTASPADILSVEQLAQFLGVTVPVVQGLTRARNRAANPIPHLRLGRRLFFRRESILAWLAAKEKERTAVTR